MQKVMVLGLALAVLAASGIVLAGGPSVMPETVTGLGKMFADDWDAEKPLTVIETGWWAGECLGRCGADMTLTPESVVYHSYTSRCVPECLEIRVELPFQEREWDHLTGLLDLEKFRTLPEVIGRPGETDAPIVHIEISNGETSKRVSFERPRELSGNEEFAEALDGILDDLASKYVADVSGQPP